LGLLSWDTKTTGCDLSELENVCNNVKHGSDTENELLIQHSTETLAVEVLINPQVSTLKQCLKNLLLARTGHKHLIYAGYSFTGSGSWILQNGAFKFSNFIDAFQDADVQKELQNNQGGTFHVHCTEEGEWTSANFQKQAIQKLIKLQLNPADKIDSLPGMPALIQCLDSALVSHTLEEIMTLSPLVGNIRFNRPTLYVFPGGEGDCALFGINGFNMLIDGGFNRKPCFWEFIRHLDRLDAVMVTRLCESNVCGITTLMKRKAINNIYPQIGYVFCNVMEGKPTPNDEITKDKNDLLVSVVNEGHTFLNNLMELNMKPHRCLRDVTNMDPFTLYQKVGHGTLEMYTLSPQKDSKEVKEFLQQWASRKETFSKVKAGVKFQEQEISIPLSHVLSICSLIVWRPANPKDTITRIFFSGSAPQNRIFEGLEKLKDLDVLKKPVCSYSSLHPTIVEKPKSKLLSKGPSIKTSPLVTNGTGRSTESLGSKKETTETESKKEIIEKRTSKTPIKKEPYKHVIENKEKKETRRSTTTTLTSTTTKKDIKEKKTPAKPTEIKKTSPTPKVTEVKSKGLKEVTNKKTVEIKTAKRKPELLKQKSPPTTETHKPKPITKSQSSTKTTTKTAKTDTSKPTKTEVKKIVSKVSTTTTAKKETPLENKETAKEPKLNGVAKLAEIPAKVEISDEKVTEEISSSPADIQTKEKELENVEPEPIKAVSPSLEKEKAEPEPILEEKQKEQIEEKLPEETKEKFSEEVTINDNLIKESVAVEEQSKTDLLLANASMEGSFCEGLMEEVQETVKEDNYIQKESTILETSPCNEEKIPVEEIIEEKSEKESLHDVMALENNEEYEILEEKVEKEDKISEFETENKVVTIKHEDLPVEENEPIKDELPVSKNNLFVDIAHKEAEIEEDTIKSPTPMAEVDYEDEGVALETTREKCEEDLPENDKILKDEAFESYEGKYQDDVLEMDKSDDREEKESSSLSEEEKLEEEEEMIRHPTPPGERNFYEKIGAIPDERSMEELDSRFMEHYLPRQGEDGYQQLYEEGEENEDESDSEGPIVEQPVYGNVIQADFPEFVNISGGTTPSEPQSPKAVYDSKQKFADVSEQLLKSTPPQEIDEDRFEEEQKIHPDFQMSPSKSLGSKVCIDEAYKEFGKDLHDEEKIIKDREDKIMEVEEEEEEEESIQKDSILEEVIHTKTIHEVHEEEIIQETTYDEELMTEKAMQEDLIQEKTMKDDIIQENEPKEQDFYAEKTDPMKEQTESFDDQQKLSPHKDVCEDRQSPLQEYDNTSFQQSMQSETDFLKERETLSPRRDLYNDRESPVEKYESRNMQETMQEQIDSFKEQDRISPCKDIYDDRESPLQEYDNKSLPESMQMHAEPFKKQEAISPSREEPIYEDHSRSLQEHDSIFTYQDQKIENEDKQLAGSDLKIEENIEHDKDIYQDEEKLLLEQDEPTTRDIYSSETTAEYQEKQIYSEVSKFEKTLDDDKNLSDDDLDSQEQSISFQHKTEDTTEHYDITSSSMFNSHPMDQSFHESYAEADRKEDEDFGTYLDEKTDKLHDQHDSYIIDKEQSRITSDSTEEHAENITASNTNGKYIEEKQETITSHYFESGEAHFEHYESYHKDAHREFAEVTEEGYYGDNERSNVDSDHPNNISRYAFQTTTESSDGDTIVSERKEFAYSTTTNGVGLSSDINGHKMEPWKNNSLLGFEADSFRNEGHDSASFYKRDFSDAYGTDNHTVPSSSELFKSDMGQKHYSDTTSINDIYLDSKDPKEIVEKETFSSMSFGYMKNDYHSEDKDDLLEHQYSEHVQKDSSKDFRLEDWSKPMGLPSPPETKSKTSSTRVSSGKSKIEKSNTSSTENVKMKMTSRMDKSNKMKTNTSSVQPVYVDLAYVPHHGDPHYSNYEFFMRIRARYYVFSGINPSKEVLNSLLEAKKSWKDDSEVTIIPTYETDTLGYWMALNQDTLIENKIDVAPSASRCTVNLQDHETSCAAYRLEF
ncbi:microtubule-associated protein futsch-like, partial [Centruroides sculpturatus]|uniref:microtubule-associated protein futsch-like n=1 Tax=Centruroides sculpturatus TaxID=218467 RepID=UPI000C6EA7A1